MTWDLDHLATPLLCVDLDRFSGSVAAVAERVCAAGKVCRATDHLGWSSLLAGHFSAGAVESVFGAQPLLQAGVRDLLIRGPVVGTKAVRQIVELVKAGADPLVACDHFVQAEMISTECLQAGIRCRVLVEVNLGRHRTGVRPGWDAVELAEGIVRLPGVRFVGGTGHAPLDEPLTATRYQSALSMLEEFRDNLQRKGLPYEVLSAGDAFPLQGTLECAALTEIQVDVWKELPANGTFSVLATVISRPKLERGVLNVGFPVGTSVEHLQVVRTALGRSIPDARIARVEERYLTLDLGSIARDLIIGDVVEVTGFPVSAVLRQFDRLYALRDGRVEKVIEPAS